MNSAQQTNTNTQQTQINKRKQAKTNKRNQHRQHTLPWKARLGEELTLNPELRR